MAIFAFKLKTIHRLKIQVEDLAKNRFGLAVSAYNEELRKLNLIQETIFATIDEFRTTSGGRFTAGRIKEYNYFLSAMRDREEAQQRNVDEAARVVDEAREALIIASRQREMFNKLRERALSRYMSEERRAEYRGTDELVSFRGNRFYK